jgi:hypothetical protein
MATLWPVGRGETELRATFGPENPNYGAINLAGGISRLRGVFQSGQLITAADMNELTLLVNTMMGHFHTYWDVQQFANFGNSGDRTLYNSYKRTSFGINGYGTATTGDVYSGGVITAGIHNGLANHIRRLASHNHTFTDNT